MCRPPASHPVTDRERRRSLAASLAACRTMVQARCHVGKFQTEKRVILANTRHPSRLDVAHFDTQIDVARAHRSLTQSGTAYRFSTATLARCAARNFRVRVGL